MKMYEMMNAIAMLACSQGFYRRLLKNLQNAKRNDPKKYEAIKNHLEAQNFESALDMILYFEGF